MLIGEQAPSGRVFRMHSSYLKGNETTGFYAIVVPYSDEFERDIDSTLIEIKEWEMLKGMCENE